MSLLEDDTQWDTTMVPAVIVQSSARLRNLFTILLLTCSPSNPGQLWEPYKESLTEDILIQAHRQNPLENEALGMAGKELKQLGLPAP